MYIATPVLMHISNEALLMRPGVDFRIAILIQNSSFSYKTSLAREGANMMISHILFIHIPSHLPSVGSAHVL